MSLDVNTFKNFIINEMFEHNKDGKRIKRKDAEIKFNLLSQILQECNAVIAGGSVLSAYTDSELNDIDIYVNKKNAVELKNKIRALGYTNIFMGSIQTQYDNSFFIKNNIIARFPIATNGYSIWNSNTQTYMDIIIVSDNVNVLQVVNNFDLTFCEIWYDGIHVHAADPKGVLEKKGYLKKDYVEKLLTCFNTFTIKRMEKYEEKGFQITYDPSVKLSEIFVNRGINCDTKVLTSKEKWVSSMIFIAIQLFFFSPDIIEFMDVNHFLLDDDDNEIRKFNELLPIYNTDDKDDDPRYSEASSFFRNIIFDIFCGCTEGRENVYSIDSITDILDCAGVQINDRKKIMTGLLAHTKIYQDTHFEYFSDILGISKKDIYKYKYKKQDGIYYNPYAFDVRGLVLDDEMESDEEEGSLDEEEGYSDEEMESDEEEGASESKTNMKEERDYNPDDYRRSMACKRKFDDDEETEENSEFVAADISNITTSLVNLRAREDDNIITKKPKHNTDSGEYDNVVFEIKSNNGDFRKVNFNRSYLKTIIRNKNNLFFECTTANKITTPIVIYVKMPLNHRKTHYYFIPIDSIKEILQNNSKTYHLYSVLQNRKQKFIQNSGSLNNLNICRSHEKIPVYRIHSTPRVYFEGTEISERF